MFAFAVVFIAGIFAQSLQLSSQSRLQLSSQLQSQPSLPGYTTSSARGYARSRSPFRSLKSIARPPGTTKTPLVRMGPRGYTHMAVTGLVVAVHGRLVRATVRCAPGCVGFFQSVPLSGSVSFNNPALGIIDSVCRYVRLRHDNFLRRFTQSGLDGTTPWSTEGPGYDVASIGGTGAVVGGLQADGVGASWSCLAVAPDDKLVSVLGRRFQNTPSILPVRGTWMQSSA